MKLADEADALAYDTAFWLLGFEADDGYALSQQGRASIELGAKLRALAIVALLTQGDSDKFHHNLVRSGRVRETYLNRMRQAGVQDDHHLASGRVDGLLDALACGDLELAHRIAWLSPRQWAPQREYEDDHCYAQILHRLIHGVQALAVHQPFLDRFEQALRGQDSPRLAVVQALVWRDQARFDEAFDSLLLTRQEEIRADVARCQLEDPIVIANRLVFVEGLALLRLAQRQGLRTQDDYLYCPSLARVPMQRPLPVYDGHAA